VLLYLAEEAGAAERERLRSSEVTILYDMLDKAHDADREIAALYRLKPPAPPRARLLRWLVSRWRNRP
jgi:hypothetical protein